MELTWTNKLNYTANLSDKLKLKLGCSQPFDQIKKLFDHTIDIHLRKNSKLRQTVSYTETRFPRSNSMIVLPRTSPLRQIILNPRTKFA